MRIRPAIASYGSGSGQLFRSLIGSSNGWEMSGGSTRLSGLENISKEKVFSGAAEGLFRSIAAVLLRYMLVTSLFMPLASLPVACLLDKSDTWIRVDFLFRTSYHAVLFIRLFEARHHT